MSTDAPQDLLLLPLPAAAQAVATASHATPSAPSLEASDGNIKQAVEQAPSTALASPPTATEATPPQAAPADASIGACSLSELVKRHLSFCGMVNTLQREAQLDIARLATLLKEARRYLLVITSISEGDMIDTPPILICVCTR